jgi:hypothetical protein
MLLLIKPAGAAAAAPAEDACIEAVALMLATALTCLTQHKHADVAVKVKVEPA